MSTWLINFNVYPVLLDQSNQKRNFEHTGSDVIASNESTSQHRAVKCYQDVDIARRKLLLSLVPQLGVAKTEVNIDFIDICSVLNCRFRGSGGGGHFSLISTSKLRTNTDIFQLILKPSIIPAPCGPIINLSAQHKLKNSLHVCTWYAELAD